MPIAYLASRFSPNQVSTPVEGYRIALSVPICRTGPQSYQGWELLEHPDCRSEWGLKDADTYQVYRPFAEVTNDATVASFEGKSVTFEHPDTPGSLLSCETEREYGRGHVQNVRVGKPLASGETPLLADLHIKDDELVDKIDSGVRDVSCGYTYRLAMQDGGQLVQRRIRGNHIAVVERGRAGRSISIQDAAPRDRFGSIHSPLQYFAGVSYEDGQAAMRNALAQARVGPELSPTHFFQGVNYDTGKRAYAEYRRRRGLLPIG